MLLLFFIVLVIAMWLPARFRFHGVFAPGRVQYEAEFKPPLLPWYFRLPFPPAPRGRDEAPAAPPEAQPAGDETGSHAGVADRLKSVSRSTGDVLARFREIYPGLRAALPATLRSFKVDRLRLSATVGTGDAYESALLAGMLRALAGAAISMASRKGVRFEERPRVNVLPAYDRPHASAEIRIAASVVPWRAAAAGLALYRQLKQAGRLDRRVVSKSPRWNTKA